MWTKSSLHIPQILSGVTVWTLSNPCLKTMSRAHLTTLTMWARWDETITPKPNAVLYSKPIIPRWVPHFIHCSSYFDVPPGKRYIWTKTMWPLCVAPEPNLYALEQIQIAPLINSFLKAIHPFSPNTLCSPIIVHVEMLSLLKNIAVSYSVEFLCSDFKHLSDPWSKIIQDILQSLKMMVHWTFPKPILLI